MKKILVTALMLVGITATAQVKVGSNPTTLATDALFQVEADNASQFFINKTNGRVGIGTIAPAAKLDVVGSVKIVDGTEGAGKVLTSDANGLATWQAGLITYIPTAQYPTFDTAPNPILSGALWVGYDATAGLWKYNKQASGRGLTDPGNPNTWTINGTTIGTFNGDLSKLPSGTHINFRYDPTSQAARYNQDDIAVRVGALWVDKYEARIVDVAGPTWEDNDDATAAAPADTDIRGNGQAIPATWMAFSQKDRGSSGMSWYVANVVSGNAGKRMLSNAEWQLAAAGTSRSDATGMAVNGETWASTADQDVSKYGVVGCVGSLWEWVADQGQYGPNTANNDGTGAISGVAVYYQNQYGVDGTWNVTGWAYTNNTAETGIAGAAWTKGLHSALIRGGGWGEGTHVGVFAFDANRAPSYWYSNVGFHAVRQ